MGIALLLHVLAAVVWVGGMFFAYVALRPAAASLLEPQQRLTLWSGVFSRFFPWVFLSIAILLCTGLWMVYAVYGGFGSVRLYISLMFGTGVVMMLIFLHVFFAPFKRLRQAVAAADWALGARQLNQIRVLIVVNLVLGLLVIAMATGCRFMVI